MIDDELIGSRSASLPKKAISYRKAKREGSKSDVVATSWDRVVVAASYHERKYSQDSSFTKLLNYVRNVYYDTNGVKLSCLVSCDRGYGNEALASATINTGMPFLFIINKNRKSFIPWRAESESELTMDKFKKRFVIDDSVLFGKETFAARASLNGKQLNSILLRDRQAKSAREASILPFVYSNLDIDRTKFVAVESAQTDSLVNFLFTGVESDVSKDFIENHIRTMSEPLSVVQRKRDWFLARNFIITGTIGQKIALRNEEVRGFLAPESNITGTVLPKKTFKELVLNWFGPSFSTSDMKVGTSNEKDVFECLKAADFVKCIYEVGVLRIKEEYIGASPDAVAILRFEQNELPNFVKRGLFSEDDIDPGENLSDRKELLLVSVEIKTKVSEKQERKWRLIKSQFLSEETLISTSTESVLPVSVGSSAYFRYVPEEYRGQCMSQCLTCDTQYCLLRIQSVSELFCTILIYAEHSKLLIYKKAIKVQVDHLLKPFHVLEGKELDTSELTGLVDRKDLAVAISNHPLWAAYQRYIRTYGLFKYGVHNFKAAVQYIYNKTKQGLDGNTFYTSTIESASIKCSWEQKLVLHGLDQVSLK